MKTIALEEHYRYPGIKEAVEWRNPALLKAFAGSGVLAEAVQGTASQCLKKEKEMRIDVHTHFQSLDFIKHLQGRNTLPKTVLEGGTYAVQCAPGLQLPSLPPMVDMEEKLRELLEQRLLVLDGSMGALLFGRKLAEADYRGERFKDHPRDVKNDVDLLNLTQPDIIYDVHASYLNAGADIIETNTFTATAISLADYGMEELAYELNLESARLGRLHNNCNVISLGQRLVSMDTALEIVRVWLETPFEGGRHQRRIDLIDGMGETGDVKRET